MTGQTAVILTRTDVWGGLETHTLDLADTLREEGFSTRIGCIGEGTYQLFQHASRNTHPLLRIECRPSMSWSGPVAWWLALRSIAADVVVFQKGTFNTGSLALDIAMRTTFGRYVAIEHLEAPPLPERTSRRYLSGLIPGVAVWWYRWKVSGYLRSVCPALTVCVSDAVRHRLLSDYRFPARKVITIRNGVDATLFRPDAGLRSHARAAWHLPSQAFVFGFIGRLTSLKQVDIAIEAFAAARRRIGGEAYLVVSGEGPERVRLERRTAELSLGEHVRFIGFQERPWEVYPGFDVLLLPSRIEAMPLVLMEAMACGCEVIASNVGGVPEIIGGTHVGTLVSPGSPVELAEAMVRSACRSDVERTAILTRAREHVVANFDRRVQYRRIGSVLATSQGRRFLPGRRDSTTAQGKEGLARSGSMPRSGV